VINLGLIFYILFHELHRRLPKRQSCWERQAFGTGSARGRGSRLQPAAGSVKSLRFPGHRTAARRPKRPEYRRIYAMREMQQLEAETRPGTGKGAAYRVRQKGLIPGVVYGGGGTPENVCVP